MNTVSVIVPLYNYRSYIRRTLESALRQTSPPMEIIVVDDGSTDNGREAFEDLIASGAVTYARQENAGVSAARNRGLRMARGEFIALLDADDIWLPTKLEKQLALFAEKPHLGLVHTRIKHVEEDLEPARKYRTWSTGAEGECFTHMLQRCGVLTSSALFRQSVLERIGFFNEGLQHSEDYLFFIRMSRFYKFGLVDEVLTLYVRRPNSAVLSSIRIHEGAVVGLIEVKSLYSLSPHEKRTLQGALSYSRHKLFLAHRNKNAPRALKYLILALWTHPTSFQVYVRAIQGILPDRVRSALERFARSCKTAWSRAF